MHYDAIDSKLIYYEQAIIVVKKTEAILAPYQQITIIALFPTIINALPR